MGRTTNQAITANDAWDMVNEEGYIVKSTFSPTFKAMTREEIEAGLHVINTDFNTYSQNRLVPYHKIQPRQTDWRAIDPYCVKDDGITYYPLTEHNAGSSNSYGAEGIVSTANYTGVKYVQRKNPDGTIRETGYDLTVDNYKEPSPFNEGDVIAITIPINELRIFKAQYFQIKRFLVPFNDLINLEQLHIRGNYIELGNMNLSNLFALDYLNISRNRINTLVLPDYTLSTNKFRYAYTGDWAGDAAPRQVINELTRYAYHSNYTGALNPGSQQRQLNTGSDVGTIDFQGFNYHYALVNNVDPTMNWEVRHISCQEEIILTSGAASNTTPIMCSFYNWDSYSNDTWITVSSSGLASNNVQNVSYSVTSNTTGVQRTGIIYVRKLKTDDSGEFQYAAQIKIIQNG